MKKTMNIVDVINTLDPEIYKNYEDIVNLIKRNKGIFCQGCKQAIASKVIMDLNLIYIVMCPECFAMILIVLRDITMNDAYAMKDFIINVKVLFRELYEWAKMEVTIRKLEEDRKKRIEFYKIDVWHEEQCKIDELFWNSMQKHMKKDKKDDEIKN